MIVAPHSIILLDELEKAHGDVLSILLQILDDGILTDGKGRTVNFKSSILIMTSNIGSKKIIEIAKDWVDKNDHDKGNPLNNPESFDTTDIISRLQSDPKAASILMNAATDGDMMNSLRLIRESTPENFDQLVRENPKMSDFLDDIWSVLNSNEREDNYSVERSSNGDDEDSGNTELYRKLFTTVKGELEATLKPEFLNRIDEVVVFSQLTRQELLAITENLLQRTMQRAKQERNISLSVSDDSLSQVMKIGSEESSLYGARPLRRAIQRLFEDPVSEAIIKGFLRDGDTALVDISCRSENCRVKITKPDDSIFATNVDIDSTTSLDDDDVNVVNGSTAVTESTNPFQNR
jgi:ATP-dependent Clp protease ATP-binding subunit ClpB